MPKKAKSKKQLKLESQKAAVTDPTNRAESAWWYENKNSIEIYIAEPHKDPLSCRIYKRQIVDWLKRANGL